MLTEWYAALHHPLGRYLRTTDPTRLKSALYAARQAAQDPALLTLTVRTSPRDPANEIWIIHGEPTNA